MKILMISTDRKILEENSGAMRRMAEYGTLCEELHIIVFAKRIRNQELGIRNKISENVFIYSTNSLSRLFYIFDACKIAKRIIHDSSFMIHDSLITCQDPFETGFAGWRIAHSLGAKLQLQIHTDFTSPYFRNQNIKNRIRVLFAKFLLSKADCVRVVSERIKKSIVSFVNAPISILPIFTDIKNIQNKPITADLHKKYPQFEKIILMVSRLESEKNVSLAIKVFARIVKKYPKAGLIIVGDGKEKERLMFHVSCFKICDNVVFEGWKNDVASYYKTVDVFLQTSNYEGYGLALVEAYAAGLPIVTTDVGVAGGLVSGDGVFICPVGDEGCLARALEQALLASRRFVRNLPLVSKEAYLFAYKKQWESCMRK